MKKVDVNRFLGMEVKMAFALANSLGMISRITSVDGVPSIVTADLNGKRMNFEVKNGSVTDCWIG